MSNPSNLRHQVAAALRFRQGVDAAPTLLGSGRGLVATRILEEARAHAVPVHEDAQLAAALCQMQAGSAIPPELYEAVAEVIAFVYGLSRRSP
ncbi:MAG: hypothetical protein RL318_1036 [Fibrobacterota bacterium]|jgi:flagellar biosynthesis protein